MKRLHLAFIVVIISFTVTACSGLRMGVGLKGEIIEGDTIVLKVIRSLYTNVSVTVCLLFGTMSTLMTRRHIIF